MFTHHFIYLPKLGNLKLDKCIPFLLSFWSFKDQLPVKWLDESNCAWPVCPWVVFIQHGDWPRSVNLKTIALCAWVNN